MRIGLLGSGTVGGAVLRALLEDPDRHDAFAGAEMRIVRAATRRPDLRAKETGADRALFTDDIGDIVGAPDVDVVAALMGGLGEEDAIRAALEAGQHVVTANKAVVAKSGPALERLAKEKDRALLFEAAVGGATPLIRALSGSLGFLKTTRLQAILNGTCNYIIGQLEHGAPLETAIGKAQHLGLAEADPSLDVEGHDAAQKLIILLGLAAGAWLSEADLSTRGVTQLEPEDTRAARLLGCSIALIAEGRRTGSGGWEASVAPRLVPEDSMLAKASSEMCAAAFLAERGGPFFLSALGAGGDATAVSVLADLASVARGGWRAEKRVSLANARPSKALAPDGDRPGWFYLRAPSEEIARGLERSAEGALRAVSLSECPRSVTTTRQLSQNELDGLLGGADGLLVARFLEPFV